MALRALRVLALAKVSFENYSERSHVPNANRRFQSKSLRNEKELARRLKVMIERSDLRHAQITGDDVRCAIGIAETSMGELLKEDPTPIELLFSNLMQNRH